MYRPWNFRYISPNEITEDLFKLELRAFFPGCKFFENDEQRMKEVYKEFEALKDFYE